MLSFLHVFHRKLANCARVERPSLRAVSQVCACPNWDNPTIVPRLSNRGGGKREIIEALHVFLGESGLLAYLVMMAVRLDELRRVLKPTGSLHLHCDPTASPSDQDRIDRACARIGGVKYPL